MADKKEWTIMVYMAGDNNLSDDMITGLIGMKNHFEKRDDIALLAYYDGGTPTVDTIYVDFTDSDGSKKIYNRTTTLGCEPKIEYRKEEGTSYYSICNFVEWCKKQQPADKYALIFSGHSDVFVQSALFIDETSYSYLSVQEFRRIMQNVSKILEKDKIDVLGFDSCAMNTLEVGYELRNVASMMVGSQGNVPGMGWDYGKIVKNLDNSTKKLKKEDVAEILVESFAETNEDYARFGGRSIDIAGCDLGEMKKVSKAVNQLSKNLETALKDSRVGKQTQQIILTSHWECQTYQFDQAIDILDFCEILRKECKNRDNKKLKAVSKTCEKVIAAVKKCVKNNKFLGPEVQYSNGISLFFPWSCISYAMTRGRYLDLEFPYGEEIEFDKEGNPRRKNDEKNPDGLINYLTEKKSDWVRFLDFYLIETMREGRKKSRSAEPQTLYGADISGVSDDNKKRFLVAPGLGEIEAVSGNGTKGNAIYDRPRGNAIYDRPRGNSIYDRPRGNSIYDRPRGNSIYDRPRGNSIYDRPRGINMKTIEDFRRMKNFPWSIRIWDDKD